MKKKFLLTGYYFDGYHGSMIHIAEVAKELVSMGFDVDIVTLELNNDIKVYVEDYSGAKVFYIKDFDLKKEYDYTLAYHAPILTLLLSKGVKLGKLALGCLSTFVDLEQPNLIGLNGVPVFAHSLELVEYLNDNYGISANLLINSVPNEYKNIELKITSLKKIAIVSNHISSEIVEARKILENGGYIIDVYGNKYNYEPINAKILANYDLIITIGKTVQYALYLGIPVYNYDHFGGCGYIKPSNIDIEEYYNFSGRSSFRKIGAQEIVSEILNGYADALACVDELKHIARERYDLHNNVVNLLIQLDKTEFKSFKEVPGLKIYEAHCSYLVNNIIHKNAIISQLWHYFRQYYSFYKFINKITFGLCFKNIIDKIDELNFKDKIY